MAVGFVVMVMMKVEVVEEVGICGSGHGLHYQSYCLMIYDLMLVMWCAVHAKMGLAPTCQVYLGEELRGALGGILVVSSIFHPTLHGSKIVESRNNQW